MYGIKGLVAWPAVGMNAFERRFIAHQFSDISSSANMHRAAHTCVASIAHTKRRTRMSFTESRRAFMKQVALLGAGALVAGAAGCAPKQVAAPTQAPKAEQPTAKKEEPTSAPAPQGKRI